MKFSYRIVSLAENKIDEIHQINMIIEILPIVGGDLELDIPKMKNKLTEAYEEHKDWLIHKCSLVVRDLAIETSIQSSKKQTAEALQALKFSIIDLTTNYVEVHELFEIHVNLKPSMAPVFYPDFDNQTIIFKDELTGNEDFEELPGMPEE